VHGVSKDEGIQDAEWPCKLESLVLRDAGRRRPAPQDEEIE